MAFFETGDIAILPKETTYVVFNGQKWGDPLEITRPIHMQYFNGTPFEYYHKLGFVEGITFYRLNPPPDPASEQAIERRAEMANEQTLYGHETEGL